MDKKTKRNSKKSTAVATPEAKPNFATRLKKDADSNAIGREDSSCVGN